MNRSALKKYAPQARLDFIEAVTMRARRLGLDPTLPVDVAQTGDVLMIAGQPFPASIASQRTVLTQRIRQQGFASVMEALAYTWFNRLIAIRFMELKGYLSHGYRVLSHPDGLQQPEILDHVQHLELPGLDRDEAIRLKTAGNQDEALYREILLAQCHELHSNMPFLFEALDDATELLLPDNLLRTDSPIARLVGDIEEGDWEQVEIIGWLYQFYISEKKDQVIGKMVKSEDIPAATQLFTPNWIVQYLVQNSLGRLWLMANPGSGLKAQMPYYIEPAEQTAEVQAQLDALIKVRMNEDGGTLNPESLTVLDPACGSGHILVEAYNLLRAIYGERGYPPREIPRLILSKNLYGLDIDDRAAQLAGFALLMKAREDDRRLFDDADNPPHLNVFAIQESSGLPDEEIAQTILTAAIQIEGGEAFQTSQLFGGGQLETRHSSGLTVRDLRELIQLFAHGKTFGSLMTVPASLKAKLGKLVDLLAAVRSQGDPLARSYATQVLEQFAWPASVLALQYDAVVANPPYMGSKGMNAALKEFAKKSFPDSKADLFAMFIERGFAWCKPTGFNSMVTMQSWMFISAYESIREKFLRDHEIHSLIQIGYNSFPELNSKIAQACAFVFGLSRIVGHSSRYVDLNKVEQSSDKSKVYLSRDDSNIYIKRQDDYSRIPGSPIAFWMSKNVWSAFERGVSLERFVKIREGINTGDNDSFLRLWYEVDFSCIARSENEVLDGSRTWCKHKKGGLFRKWYGNTSYVLNWRWGGKDIHDFHGLPLDYNGAPMRGKEYFFKPSISWSRVSTSDFAVRYYDGSYSYDSTAPSVFCEEEKLFVYVALLNSKVVSHFLGGMSPTLDFRLTSVGRIPVISELVSGSSGGLEKLSRECISISKEDWSVREESWEFDGFPLVGIGCENIDLSWSEFSNKCKNRLSSLIYCEREINEILVKSYGLDKELDSSVGSEKINFYLADKTLDSQRLVSYAIGCMMGRYSLDELGLIYANSGGVGFDSSRYRKFPADTDGIIPITEESWFDDDAAERVHEFVKVVWGADTLVDNMEWLADSLGRKSGDSADEAIRRYLSTSFYKDHLQTYKKRPIYWLFSSGKQKAFECLVYLHRYNEGTLSRMRMEYVVPLQSRMQARIDKLSDDIAAATSSAQQKALQKRKDKLTKQLEELRRFDEALRPYADQRIKLDLDDGVKVNYGKFGNLLAEVKAVTGGKED